MNPLESYLRELRDIRSTGAAVKETSYYPALSTLLNVVGRELKPTVRCIINLKNQGAGLPDGGLFTPDQFQKGTEEPRSGQPPSRGAIECKGVKDDAWVTAGSDQVTQYWNKYRQVLVTNYRDFVLVGQDDGGKPVILEAYRLAANEKAFWEAAGRAAETATAHGERFIEYLKRVMLHAAPLSAPEDLAWFLASYARDAKARLGTLPLPAIASTRKALEQALGIKFQGTPTDPQHGERFFRSTLVQTLFYGIFSAWVLWHRKGAKAGEAFDWEKTPNFLSIPILRKLFRESADRQQLDEWRLAEVLDWTGAVLNRVDRAAFFERFTDAAAVQYFYEPFLAEFDPELRKELGVWYTPPEVVRYMVARVDAALREELGIEDGLADPNVYALDPCCGTGAFLVEVLRVVSATLKEKGEDALLASKLKDAVTRRLFGFELLPAPFVVAHLQIGLFLQSEGAPLLVKNKDRAAIYLTNALTGWVPDTTPRDGYLFPELNEERDRSNDIKQQKPILVVLGNPPYNGYAGMGVDEERGLSDDYRKPVDGLAPQGQGLNDLYVRFFRMAERCIVERPPGRGVVCFISNYSWLDSRSCPVMRRRFLDEFDQVWIDSLNGDKRKSGKKTPDGQPDPSIFSTEQNREGIQVGTAISLLVRKEGHRGPARVLFRDLWGKDKRGDLLRSLEGFGPRLYCEVVPEPSLGLPFRPMTLGGEYARWPLLADLFISCFVGVKTSRDEVVVDVDRAVLVERMTRYFDPGISHEEMKRISPRAMTDAENFVAIPTRDTLLKRGFQATAIVPFAYRPFDTRWLYWETETTLLNRSRPEYLPHVVRGNYWLTATQQNRKGFDPPSVPQLAASIHLIERTANLFPLLLAEWPAGARMLGDHAREARRLGEHYANLSDKALDYLADKGGVESAADMFFHVVAVLHAPSYAVENEGALRQDWPRVPLPTTRERLMRSAALGRQVAGLLDTESGVTGVTAGKPRPELRLLGNMARVGGGHIDADAGELDVKARWGYRDTRGACMPGPGRLEEREFSVEERVPFAEAGLTLDALGATTFDVYLNEVAYLRNVPAGVWSYSLGGYQVMKKWLSYREKDILGRGLTLDEVGAVTGMARRIAALVLLRSALDENYRAVAVSR